MLARASTVSLVSFALLAACGDSTGGTEGHTGAGSSTGGGTSGSTAPTSSSATGEATAPTGGASESASSVTTGDPPDPTTSTTAGETTTGETTAGETTTGGPVEPDGCVQSVDGWCWLHPLPHGNTLRDIWPDGAGRVWVVGEGNTLSWNDGQGWHTRSADATEGLRGIWGAAPNDVWAVGDRGLILHFDGNDWTKAPSPATKTLRAVWGSGPTDIYAGGDGGAMFHFDGVAWTAYDPGLAISDVLSIWGLGADDVWVTTAGFGGPTIHWDGMAWSYRSVGEQGSATAVWGRGPDDVYVTLDQTVVMAHWTGDPIWEELKYPGAQPMYGVVGTDTELWIGGRNMMLHHDGNAWSEVQEFESTQLYSLDRAEDDILAVGARGVIGRMHDGAWKVEAGGLGPLGTIYGSVWGYAADDVWVGGWPLGHWDGESLSFPDLGLDTFQRIGALAGADGELWGLGEDLGKDTVWHHDGGLVWSKVLDLPDSSPSALWAADATTLWIGGEYVNGDIMRWDGQKLELFKFTGQFSVHEFHGLAPDDIWAIGSLERLLHWDGVEWKIVHEDWNGDYLQGVWEFAPNDVWTAGSSGRVYHWDGVSWTEEKLTTWGFNDLWGRAPDDLWAVGGLQASHGVIFHYDGNAWTEVVSGSGEPLISLWGIDGDLWAVGYEDSVLIHRDR